MIHGTAPLVQSTFPSPTEKTPWLGFPEITKSRQSQSSTKGVVKRKEKLKKMKKDKKGEGLEPLF